MSAGKSASQAGHAFLDSYLTAPPDIVSSYLDHGGTKIVLTARSESELRTAYDRASAAGLPCSMIVDNGHVSPPSFDGETPVLTAIGIGPVARDTARPITKRFSLMK